MDVSVNHPVEKCCCIPALFNSAADRYMYVQDRTRPPALRQAGLARDAPPLSLPHYIDP